MKFSIIVPVYNVEKYINKCLDSILNQTYNNFEVIIVNDGTEDNSQIIIDKYCKNDNRFRTYKKQNTGLADTRNYAIKFVTGDYILFLDSDDFYEKELLNTLNKSIKDSIDIVKFECQLIDENNIILKKYANHHFDNLNKLDVLKLIVQDDLVDSFCIYAFNYNFYISNHFKCEKGKLHEDFGLVPFIILKAQSIISIDYLGLNYLKRSQSITNTHNSDHEQKKILDFFEQYQLLVGKITNDITNQDEKNIILIFITDAVLRKYQSLKGTLKKEFGKLIRKSKIYINIPNDSVKRFIKKSSLKISLNLYLLLTKLSRK
ncbi:MAG: glycosyltransferase family 2 protein [Bacilli bacterium]